VPTPVFHTDRVRPALPHNPSIHRVQHAWRYRSRQHREPVIVTAYESTRSARVLPVLGQLAADGWLGEAIEISDESEIRQVNAIRRAVFGGTDDEPLKHLGEAQTCFVISNWNELAGSWWVSDDREALRYARLQGITTRETIDLVSIAVVNGYIETQEGFNLMRQMGDQGRCLRLACGSSALTKTQSA
jgi:hypothetical protein